MMMVLWYRGARLALVAVVAVRNGVAFVLPQSRELHPAGRRTTGPCYPCFGTPPLVPDPATPRCCSVLERRGHGLVGRFTPGTMGNLQQLTTSRLAYLGGLAVFGPVEAGGDCA